MTPISEQRKTNFQTAITKFLQERLDAKLAKLKPDDPAGDDLRTRYRPDAWLEDAARRVAQIQAVTHTLKPIHPDARGTNIYCPPSALAAREELGSHVLGDAFDGDVVGNAAALDVYKFLKVPVEDRPLLDWMLAGDADLAAALHDDAATARSWMEAFAGIVQPRTPEASTHTRAKQLYWLTGEDPCEDAGYTLLAPLYASSLAHAVFRTINEDRFGEAAKAAREARWEHRDHPTGLREYHGLAVQKLGGTKPQNISQLNSERGGNNYLLASLPPHWRTRAVRAPLRMDSIFPGFGKRAEVSATVRRLDAFLRTNPPPTMDTRNHREALVDALIDELVDYATPLQTTLPAGWTRDPDCRLVEAECLWLDPGRALSAPPDDPAFAAAWHAMDWPADIGRRFAQWLNAQLKDQLPVGDAEARQWQKELLLDESPEGFAWQLDRMRGQADAPTYIPTREATR